MVEKNYDDIISNAELRIHRFGPEILYLTPNSDICPNVTDVILRPTKLQRTEG